MLIINALGGIDNPNADLNPADALHVTSAEIAVDARALADAHASGLTAVNITLGYVMGDYPPYAHTLHELDIWDGIIAAHPADLLKVLTVARHPPRRSAESDRHHLRLPERRPTRRRTPRRVKQFADLGVRVVQLTYNQANHLGDGSMAPENGGLTPFGREVVEALNDARLMVDLSHSGENTCLDAARPLEQPISINHTGCRALTDLPRNKTDEELRLVADGGGFVGIYFMPFLNPTGHATAAGRRRPHRARRQRLRRGPRRHRHRWFPDPHRRPRRLPRHPRSRGRERGPEWRRRHRRAGRHLALRPRPARRRPVPHAGPLPRTARLQPDPHREDPRP